MEPEDYLDVLRSGDVLLFIRLIDCLMEKWNLSEAGMDNLLPVITYTFLNSGVTEKDFICFAILNKLSNDQKLTQYMQDSERFAITLFISGFVSALIEIKLKAANTYCVDVESVEGIVSLFDSQLETLEQSMERRALTESIMDSLEKQPPQLEEKYLEVRENLSLFLQVRAEFNAYKVSLQITGDESRQRFQDILAIIQNLMEVTQLTENIVLKIYAMFDKWQHQSNYGKEEKEFCKRIEPLLSKKLSPDIAKKMLKQSMVEDWMELNIFDMGRTVVNWVSMSLFSTTNNNYEKKDKPHGQITATL